MPAFAGMATGFLRQDQDARNDEGRENCRGIKSAHCQSAIGDRLIEQVADRCTEGACQDESAPKQKRARDIRPEIQTSEHHEASAKYESPAFVAEPVCVSHPVAKC